MGKREFCGWYLYGLLKSYEFLVLIVGFAVWYFGRRYLCVYTDKLFASTDAINWIAVVAPGCFITYMVEIKNIWNPSHEHVKIFQQWPDFEMIKAYCYAGITYGLLASIASVFLWLVGDNVCSACRIIGWLVSIAVAGIVAVSGSIAENEVLESLNKIEK